MAMETEGYGSGIFAAVTRLYHKAQNIPLARWHLIDLWSHNRFGLDKLPKRSGDVAVITGGARGVGSEVVKKLLQADMQVFIGCRNASSGNDMIKNLRDAGIASGHAECIHLDLKSLESVRKFAKSILDKNLPIHILINNAGILWVPFEVTPDGFESHFQVNYLGHFLLTNLLLRRLATSARDGNISRIINVTSTTHYCGVIDFDNLQLKKNYSDAGGYQNTKLMQVVSSNFLDSKLQRNNIKVRSLSVHPGTVLSHLYDHFYGISLLKGVLSKVMMSTEDGADGVTNAALSPQWENKGGLFLANSQEMPHSKTAIDGDVQQKLWEVSCELIEIDKGQLDIELATGFKN